MRTVTVERAVIDPAGLAGQAPSRDGLAELPVDTVVTNAEGQVLVAYLRLWERGDAQLERLRAGLLGLDFPASIRTNGLSVRAMSFGNLPRNHLRTDFCRPAVVSRQHPQLARDLTELAAQLEGRYAELAPAGYAYHAEQAARIEDEWRLPGAKCFTGATLNRDNAVGYHRDKGNFKATFSAMPIVRHGMAGGELVVPELGYWLPVEDGTVVYFDGQDLWHAVTSMRKRTRTAHRFSAVFYSLTDLWQCLPPAGEVERHQARRTEKEERRRHDSSVAGVPAALRAKAEARKLERSQP